MNPGRKKSVTLNGRRWLLSRLELSVILALRDWIALQVGDPFALAEKFLSRFSDVKEQRDLIREGEEIRRQLMGFTLACPLAQRFLATEVGAAKLVHLLLLEHQPDASEADAFAVAVALGEQKRVVQTTIEVRLKVELARARKGESVNVEALAEQLTACAYGQPMPTDILPDLVAELGGGLGNGQSSPPASAEAVTATV